MYIIKLQDYSDYICNKISTSFIVLYADRTLEIATCVIRIPNQDEFFNVLPLLKQVKDLAKAQLALGPCKSNKSTDEVKVYSYEYAEQDIKIKDPEIRLTVLDDNRPLISNKPTNLCVVIGVEHTKGEHIKPYFQIAGADNYQDWSFIYGATNKLVSNHGDKLSSMELDLIESHEETKTADEIIEELD
jgi:hypothetical protein